MHALTLPVGVELMLRALTLPIGMESTPRALVLPVGVEHRYLMPPVGAEFMLRALMPHVGAESTLHVLMLPIGMESTLDACIDASGWRRVHTPGVDTPSLETFHNSSALSNFINDGRVEQADRQKS